MDVEAENIIRLGVYKAGSKRPILVKFRKFSLMVEIIIISAKCLKGLNIWIMMIIQKKVRMERKKLILQHLKTSTAKRKSASRRYDKLMLNGKLFGSEQFNNEEGIDNEDRKSSINEHPPQSDEGLVSN